MADDIGGVWRTISGRRIFIKDGQSLSDAMRESGKFNNNEIDIIKRIQNNGYEYYKNLDANSKSMLEYYTSGNGMDVNQVLRGFQEEEPIHTEMIKDIENAFKDAELKDTTIVYRALNERFTNTYNISETDLENAIYGGNIDVIKTKLGDSIIEKGLMSTSLDLQEADYMLYSPTKSIIMELETQPSNKGFYIGKNSSVPTQEEIIFAPNHNIIIKDVYARKYEFEDDGITCSRAAVFVKGEISYENRN